MNSGLASPPSTAAKPRPARAALWPAAAATAPLFRLQIARPRRGESLVDEERFLKTTCSLRLRDYAPSGQHAALGRHRGLAAHGVVGQDRHHVAPDGPQLVAVVDPAGAVHLARAFERPSHLMLRVAMSRRARNASASVMLRPELTAAVLASRPTCSNGVATSIAAAAGARSGRGGISARARSSIARSHPAGQPRSPRFPTAVLLASRARSARSIWTLGDLNGMRI